MLRVTTDTRGVDIWYVHKVLGTDWVPFALLTRNLPPYSLREVYRTMVWGSFDTSGENSNYTHIKQHGTFTEAFYQDAQDFKDQHVEEFI